MLSVMKQLIESSSMICVFLRNMNPICYFFLLTDFQDVIISCPLSGWVCSWNSTSRH
jgi:hypothetical protein